MLGKSNRQAGLVKSTGKVSKTKHARGIHGLEIAEFRVSQDKRYGPAPGTGSHECPKHGLQSSTGIDRRKE